MARVGEEGEGGAEAGALQPLGVAVDTVPGHRVHLHTALQTRPAPPRPAPPSYLAVLGGEGGLGGGEAGQQELGLLGPVPGVEHQQLEPAREEVRVGEGAGLQLTCVGTSPDCSPPPPRPAVLPPSPSCTYLKLLEIGTLLKLLEF